MNQSSNIWRKYLGIDHILLLVIVIAGTVLRFYNFSELPYSFDEFSALFRTRFDNFRDLIYFGVKTTDTHPAGVQVFMYYWVKVFGESEVFVKFPFIVFGILSIIWGYKVATKWFNPTVGLFTALFLSVLQYPITYSQFARPYVSGLFLCLLMVWYWTMLVFHSEKKPIRNVIGFALSAALCAYNHHFSLLLVGLVGISGLFFIKKKCLIKYLITCALIFALYTPHLSIFFTQLGRGGVEDWLSKPEPNFILDYFQYILHFSYGLIGITCILIFLGFLFLSKEIKQTNKFRLLALLWFTIIFLVGYFYSVYVNALLQYSVLLFTFPFLVIFVFSFYKDLKPVYKIIIVLAFMAMSIYTLIYERNHYEIQYKSAYKEILVESDKINAKYGKKNVTTIIRLPQNIKEYYLQKLEIDGENYYDIDSLGDFKQFRKFLSSQSSEYLIMGWSSISRIEYKLIAEEFYPFVIAKQNWFKGNLFVYSRTNSDVQDFNSADSIIYSSINYFDHFSEGWEDVVLSYQLAPGVNYEGDQILRLNKYFEYTPSFSGNLKKISNSGTNEIYISVDMYLPGKMANPTLICDFLSEGKRIDWRASKIAEFIDEPNKRLKAYLAVKLVDVDLDHPDIIVSTYIWNPGFEDAFIDDFKIEVREGNPVIYGLYEKF